MPRAIKLQYQKGALLTNAVTKPVFNASVPAVTRIGPGLTKISGTLQRSPSFPYQKPALTPLRTGSVLASHHMFANSPVWSLYQVTTNHLQTPSKISPQKASITGPWTPTCRKRFTFADTAWQVASGHNPYLYWTGQPLDYHKDSQLSTHPLFGI